MLFLTGPAKTLVARTTTSGWDTFKPHPPDADDADKEGEDGDASPQLDDALIMIKPNMGCHLFVALTKNIVYLWSTRPHVMLSKVIRSEITMIEDGENQDVIWRSDSTATRRKGGCPKHIHSI
ncbi:hypothetical protein HDU67_002852 [Dinochytrium kinnereticum]|nr:hypothetical protein HDU67_002852 [Dinochytrium kinnereticum]